MRSLNQHLAPSRRRLGKATICAATGFALTFGIGHDSLLFAQTQTTDFRASQQPSARRQSELVQHRLPPTNLPEEIIPGNTEPVMGADGLSLEDLQNLALQNNPALAQTWQKVRAAEGQWLQAGLRPNPIVGYQASEVGNDGQSGQQGAFFSQEFVRRKKLALSRATQSQEVARARQEYAAQRMRVLNDVRAEHFNVLVGQRAMDLTDEIASISQRAVETTERMYEGKVIPYSDVLQARIEAKSADISVTNARNRYGAAWRRLSGVIGMTGLPPRPLAGSLSQPDDDLSFEETLRMLYLQSPQLAGARIAVMRARAALEREQVEPMPNFDVQMGLQYDNASQYTIGNVQVGIPIPVLNANQGNIQTAYADLRNAQANVGRLEMSLHNQLASAFEVYANAKNQVEQFTKDILPDARRTLDLVNKGFQSGEYTFLTLLTVQRTYFQANLAYLQALQQLGVSRVAIEGLLLTGSLQEERAIDVPRVDTGTAPVFGPGRPPVQTQ